MKKERKKGVTIFKLHLVKWKIKGEFDLELGEKTIRYEEEMFVKSNQKIIELLIQGDFYFKL